ncbi:MAG: menaquinone biosynthesis family protein [Terrimicrobiaceae bacterium]|jgi:1,4-dihydroxy-6-naphthoate synthase
MMTTDWKSLTLTLGHSPDPDDAFMFYAMAEGKIDLRGYRFEHILQDIQTLNERATRGELHITAVSIHALAHLLDKYLPLPSGASMGDGYGPMFITTDPAGSAFATDDERREWLRSRLIAVPGKMTSAYLAAQIYLGADFRHVVVPFDEIFDAVKSGRADVGLIIHEGQVTYARDGFSLVRDLGAWWKESTGLPLPLGGNIVRRDIPPEVRTELSDILRESIRYGLENRRPAVEHSMAHARGMDIPLADQFIGMYVNDFTIDYGETGRAAIRKFLGEAAQLGLVPPVSDLEFVE